jgi:hypothetical protein
MKHPILACLALGLTVISGSAMSQWEGDGPRWNYNGQETMYVGGLQSGGEGFSMAYAWKDNGGLEMWPRASFMNKVFIGDKNTSCLTCKLAVDGEVKAQSITVEETITANDVSVKAEGWADYVFKDDYDLMPLNTLEAFIDENGHLPGVPTAEEAAENGVSMAQMSSVLLEKVEQLTLYVIELKKENDQLKAAISAQAGQ